MPNDLGLFLVQYQGGVFVLVIAQQPAGIERTSPRWYLLRTAQRMLPAYDVIFILRKENYPNLTGLNSITKSLRAYGIEQYYNDIKNFITLHAKNETRSSLIYIEIV